MQRKVKTFLYVFRHSIIPQSTYYGKILKSPLKFSLKYFIGLIILLNLILTIYISVKFNPVRVSKFVTSIRQSFDRYPPELVINVAKGKLFTSYNRPYFLWADIDGQKKLLLVVDETALPEKINIYNSTILLTSKEIVIKTGEVTDNKFSSLDLSYLSDQSINKQTIQNSIQFLAVIQKLFYIGYIIFVPLLILLLPLVSFLITIFYLAVISLIINSLFKFYYHKHTHFKKTFQLSLHAVTFPLLLDYFLILFKPSIQANIKFQPFLPTPLVFLILLTIFVFVGVYEAYLDGKTHRK